MLKLKTNVYHVHFFEFIVSIVGQYSEMISVPSIERSFEFYTIMIHPHQSIHFLSYDFFFSRFKNRRFLTFHKCLFELKAHSMLLPRLTRLHCLAHLKFIDCKFNVNDEIDCQDMIDQIWSVSELVHDY
jgi:hypothetical protein